MEDEAGNPDAAQDKVLTLEIMKQELGPVFQMLNKRLEMVENECKETRIPIYGHYDYGSSY